MKKLVLIVFFVSTSFFAKSEIWIDFGLKAGYSPGVLINPYIFNNNTQALKYNHGFLYGGKIGINFGLTNSLTADLLYVSTKQTLHNSLSNTNIDLTFNTLDLPIMFRSNGENGGYGEIGPQFSFLNSSVHSLMGDVKSNFNATNFGLAAGFGQYIAGGDLFGLTLGFRFAYTFADLVNPSNKDNQNNPVYQPVTAEEIALDYKANSRLYAGVLLEFNFNLGYFTQGSRCAKRTRFKMF